LSPKIRYLPLEKLWKGREGKMAEIDPDGLLPLPPPYEGSKVPIPLSDPDLSLDGFETLSVPPLDKEREEEVIARFIQGLKRLLDGRDNWTFLMPLSFTLEYCAGCQACSEACPIYVSSGRCDIYRPTYRTEILRRLVRKYAKPFGRARARLEGTDIEIDIALIKRLYELSYRCTLCRRCAQACPMGIDNGLVTREIRKLFSQELGWAPEELHERGTLMHLREGSATGITPELLKENVDFLVEEYSQSTGFEIRVAWEKEDADFFLVPSAGTILVDAQNFAALLLLLNLAGLNFTMSLEAPAYDGVNFGLFYDDIQFARILSRQARVAKRLRAKRMLLVECGHQHKAFLSLGERLLGQDLRIPVQDVVGLLEEIVFGGKIEFEPSNNDFPVTLHDPCNMVRSLGIVEPQRRILKYLCSKFREMSPRGLENFCCGGGGGLVLLGMPHFKAWRAAVSGRMKFKQILEAFSDCPQPETKKYVCAPCLNCRLQIRDILHYFGAKEKSGIYSGGLSELIANAVKGIREPLIKWEDL
jgi:Fe-S oxidoreductase